MRRATSNFLGTASITSNSARMEVQCRKAWQAWADHVEAVIGQSPSGDCFPVAVAVESGPLPVSIGDAKADMVSAT